ncbi:MAG: metal ABC transporter substrate-binding protein [candidate division WOR-3 bacterium]
MIFLLFVLDLCIITSTSDIYSVVKEIAPFQTEVLNLVPEGSCPGHFDLSPREAGFLNRADLIIYHGFEPWIKKIRKINSKVKLIDLKTDESWMVPSVYLKGALEICEVLKMEMEDSSNRKLIEENYKRLISKIDSLSLKIMLKRDSLNGIKVICNEYQREFLSFLGMEVISTFPKEEKLTLKELSNILNIGKEKNVEIVVDNLQTRGKIGRMIAIELSKPFVILSNFPDRKGYKETVLDNIKIILEGLK